MRRRRFLVAVGASLTLAGCGSQGSAPGDDPDASTPEDTDPGDTDSGNPTETTDPSGTDTPDAPSDPGHQPSRTETTDPSGTDTPDGFVLGETTGDVSPHGLTVRNDGGDPQTGRLRVTDADTGETLLDRSYTLGAGETIGGELRGPATYEVRVTVSGAGTEHRTTVEYFDTCNSYGTTVTIAADGSMTSETVRTLVACDPGTPSVDGFALGETTGDVNPHELTVYNGDSVTRTVDLRVVETDTGETLLDRSFSLSAGGDVSGELRGPATYEVRVAVPEAGTEDVTTVEYFDTCNDYGTNVTIAADASLSSETFTTAEKCGA